MKADTSKKTGSDARTISVVIPVRDERPALDELTGRLTRVLDGFADRYEVIIVDDGSSDGSIEKLREFSVTTPAIKYIRFRRNFGKSAALAAGFRMAAYRIIVTMDGDLQDIPEELPMLVGKLEEGFDLVSGWRYDRKDRLTKRMASRIYNRATSILTGVRLHDINCGFKCYRREVLDEVNVYGERHRYIPVLASYRGFKMSEVRIKHAMRAHGHSRYGMGRVLGGLFSLLTVILMTRYTNKPLHFFGLMGLMLAGLGSAIDLYLIAMRVLFKEWLSNRPLLIVGTLLVIVGVQFVLFGLLAEMIAFSYRREDDYSTVETSEDREVIKADERAVEMGKGRLSE